MTAFPDRDSDLSSPHLKSGQRKTQERDRIENKEVHEAVRIKTQRELVFATFFVFTFSSYLEHVGSCAKL